MLRPSTTTANCVEWGLNQVLEGTSRFSRRSLDVHAPDEDRPDSDSEEEKEEDASTQPTVPLLSLDDQISSENQALIAARAHQKSLKQLVFDHDQTLSVIQDHADWVIAQSPLDKGYKRWSRSPGNAALVVCSTINYSAIGPNANPTSPPTVAGRTRSSNLDSSHSLPPQPPRRISRAFTLPSRNRTEPSTRKRLNFPTRNEEQLNNVLDSADELSTSNPLVCRIPTAGNTPTLSGRSASLPPRLDADNTEPFCPETPPPFPSTPLYTPDHDPLLEEWSDVLDSNTDLSPTTLDEQHVDETQLDPFQQTHVDDQPVIEFSEELNLTQPPVLTESAEQPHHCTGDVSPQPTDYDDVAVSAPSLAVHAENERTPVEKTVSLRKRNGNQGKKQKKELKITTPRPANWDLMSPKMRKKQHSHNN